MPTPEERRATATLARNLKNPLHTAVFATLFVSMIVLLPLLTGGLFGYLLAPIVAGVVWALYRVTLPRGKLIPSVAETAGTTACPACGSMQTDRMQFRNDDDPHWQCFACEHRW